MNMEFRRDSIKERAVLMQKANFFPAKFRRIFLADGMVADQRSYN